MYVIEIYVRTCNITIISHFQYQQYYSNSAYTMAPYYVCMPVCLVCLVCMYTIYSAKNGGVTQSQYSMPQGNSQYYVTYNYVMHNCMHNNGNKSIEHIQEIV